MKKQPKKVYTKKTLSYTMPPDVVKEIEEIMRIEGYNTMSRAINKCILIHRQLCDQLSKADNEANKLYHEKMTIESEIAKLASFNEFLKKHTKMS